MNKGKTILLHAAGWLIILCSPFMYIDHWSSFSFTRYLFYSMAPLMLMVVFYLNYLFLVPRYYIRGNRLLFFAVNVVATVCLAVALHYWIRLGHAIFERPPHKFPGPHSFLEVHFSSLFFLVRDMFNLIVTAAGATAIKLAENWHHAELARQKAEKERSIAELKNLRSQFNPHFLLNTLNNIYALTSFSPERAQKAIVQLSGLLRHVLYGNENSENDIHDELRFLQDYISLMKLRLTSNVEVTFNTNITPDVKATIAPMIIISLVENAFKHGVSPTLPSFVDININVHDNTIDCLIRNSNFPKSAGDKSGHGIGLQQVARRLELSYPGRYQWNQFVRDDIFHSHIIITQLL